MQSPDPKKSSSKLGVACVLITLCGYPCCYVMWSLFGLYASARPPASVTTCRSNLKQVALGFLIYAGDNDDHFPAGPVWGDKVISEVGEDKRVRFRCPEVKEPKSYGYAMIDKASKLSSEKIPDPTSFILLFESSDLSWNAHSPTPNFPVSARHGEGNNVAFADGHVKTLKVP